MNKNYRLLILILCRLRKAIYFVVSIEGKSAEPHLQRKDTVIRFKMKDKNLRYKNSICHMMYCSSQRWWVDHPWTRNKTKNMSLTASFLSEKLPAIELISSEKILPIPSRRNQEGESRLESRKLHWEICTKCCCSKNLKTNFLVLDSRHKRMEVHRIIFLNNRVKNFLTRKIFLRKIVYKIEK